MTIIGMKGREEHPVAQREELKFIRFSKQYTNDCDWLAAASYSTLRSLNGEYPRFAVWYENLFSSHARIDNNREMLLCLHGRTVAGVAILKYSEKKVCTLRVRKEYRGQSIGTRLLEGAFELLETSRPLITVRSTRLVEYKGLFDRYGFKMEDCRHAYYSLLHSECAFNGILDKRVPFFSTIEVLKARAILGGFDTVNWLPPNAGDSMTTSLLGLRPTNGSLLLS